MNKGDRFQCKEDLLIGKVILGKRGDHGTVKHVTGPHTFDVLIDGSDCQMGVHDSEIEPIPQGMKFDQKKPRWDLLPFSAVREVVKVLTHGAKKYADNNWMLTVKDNPDRYFAAAMRHIEAWRSGEIYDKESGIQHLAHAVCCLLFLIWNEIKGE